MMFHPNCPKPPSDIDKEVLRIQMQGMEPLTQEEYKAWTVSSGNSSISGREKVRHMFARKKIEKWFSEHGTGGRVSTKLSDTPFTYELLEACASKIPPTEMEIPGVDLKSAKEAIAAFHVLIFARDYFSAFGEAGFCCGFCGEEESESTPLMRCARCKKMKYCSKEVSICALAWNPSDCESSRDLIIFKILKCQRRHWNQHLQSCEPASAMTCSC